MKTSDFPDLELMRRGVEHRFEIGMRGYKVQVRPLTTAEIIDASAEAAEAFQKMSQNRQLNITASLLNAMYQLEKASSPDVGMPGKITMALMQKMTTEEINHLWKQYVRVVDKVNPSLEEVPVETLDQWVEDLKKNSDPLSLLTDLSISNLIALCLHLSKASNA